MKATLLKGKVKINNEVVGYYVMDNIGISRWYAEFEYNGTIYVEHAPTLNDLRLEVKNTAQSL